MQAAFVSKVLSHWTPERLKKLTSGHKYMVLPTTAPELLRVLGILNQDGSMSADSTRKYIQINHLLSQLAKPLQELSSRHKTVRILDAGCGSSILTFLLAWSYKSLWNHPVWLLGIDSNAKLIAKNRKNADDMKVSDHLLFAESPIAGFDWLAELAKHQDTADQDAKSLRPHAVVALHACDTATDDALALAIHQKADLIAVAPCCQAELAKHWKHLADQRVESPMRAAFMNPHLRREIAAHVTDLMRVLILRGHGYEVTTTEFTMSHATPKNTLILAERRGSYHRESQKELAELVKSLGGLGISLMEKAPFTAAPS